VLGSNQTASLTASYPPQACRLIITAAILVTAMLKKCTARSGRPCDFVRLIVCPSLERYIHPDYQVFPIPTRCSSVVHLVSSYAIALLKNCTNKFFFYDRHFRYVLFAGVIRTCYCTQVPYIHPRSTHIVQLPVEGYPSPDTGLPPGLPCPAECTANHIG
jgi:hypothetical protein